MLLSDSQLYRLFLLHALHGGSTIRVSRAFRTWAILISKEGLEVL
jgi:hypothetical protein